MNEKARIIVVLVIVAVGILAFTSNLKRQTKPRKEPTAAERRERIFNTVDARGSAPFRRAEQEALQRWPEFVAAFSKREVGVTYAVCGKFVDGNKTAWMWVEVESLDGDNIRGTLSNEPLDLKNVKKGQRVTVARQDIDDWIVERNGRAVQGGFTTESLEAVQQERMLR
jgi:uncharacterized protein YegJ (DUF2314 family)